MKRVMKKLARFKLVFSRPRFGFGLIMRILTLLLAANILLLASVFPTINASAEPTARKILSGWIPYYGMNTSLPTAVANPDLISEVMPFWYTLKLKSKTNSPYIQDLYTPGNPSVAIEVPLATMRSAGFKIIPTITDGTEKLVLAKLLAKSSDRAAVIKSIIDLVTKNNFDGIDLDFEGFAFVDGTASWPTTKPNWVLFVKELSAVLHASGKLLSITAPVHFPLTEKQKGYTVYAWAEIASSIDRLRIMTYDYSTSRPGPIGPIEWVERTVKYAISVMPASKVYIGLAGYGRDWVTNVEGICPSNLVKVITPSAKAATFVMRNAAMLASTYGAVPIFDQKYQEATFTYQKTYNGNNASGQATTCVATRTAWYQNSASYAVRTQLVAKYRLGGVAQWTMGMEDQGATDGIRAIALAIAPDKVLLSLASDQSSIKYGQSINLSTLATLEDKNPIANVLIHLEFMGFDESEWREVGTFKTSDLGAFNQAIYLAKSGKLKIRTDGSWERSAGLSLEIPITINPRLKITAPTSAKTAVPFKVLVDVLPMSPTTQISLQRASGSDWRNVSTTTFASSGSLVELSATELTRGIFSYRVSVTNSADNSQTISPAFILIVN